MSGVNSIAVFAEESVLDSHEAKRYFESQSNRHILNYRGWQFKSKHDKICPSSEFPILAMQIKTILDEMPEADVNPVDHQHEVHDHIDIDNTSLHIPPMLFLHDELILEPLKSQSYLLLNAEDALSCWAAGHTKQYKTMKELNIPRVSYSNTWLQRSVDLCIVDAKEHAQSNDSQVNEAARQTQSMPKNDVGRDIQSLSKQQKLERSSEDEAVEVVRGNLMREWDWTFTSDYCFSIKNKTVSNVESEMVEDTDIISGYLLSRVTSTACATDPNETNASISKMIYGFPYMKLYQRPRQWVWTRTNYSGLNMNLLRATDVPILLYDNITFYQDDLEDCGEVSFNAKLRVMPSFWFLLSRLFLRVDDVIIRIKETRLYHEFDSDPDTPIIIHVEIIWKEMNIKDIQLPQDQSSNVNPNMSTVLPPSMISRAQPPNGVSTIRPPCPASNMMTGSSIRVQSSIPTIRYDLNPPTSTNNTSKPWYQMIRDPNMLSEKLPLVNEQENVHQFYTLTLR